MTAYTLQDDTRSLQYQVTCQYALKQSLPLHKRPGPHYKVQPVKGFNEIMFVYPKTHTKLTVTFCWKAVKTVTYSCQCTLKGLHFYVFKGTTSAPYISKWLSTSHTGSKVLVLYTVFMFLTRDVV